MKTPRMCGPFDVVGNCERCNRPLMRFCQECGVQQRSAMRPGQMFLINTRQHLRGHETEGEYVMVVLDRLHETDFWRGGRYCYGDIAPSVEFEVLS